MSDKECLVREKSNHNYAYNYDLLNADIKLLKYYRSALVQELNGKDEKLLQKHHDKLTSQDNDDGRLLIQYDDVLFLHKCLNNGISRNGEVVPMVHLYELMSLMVLQLPSPALLERTPDYISRMERLGLRAAEVEYQKMTKNVGNKGFPKESIGQELRQMDSQVTFLLNFFLTVVGAFAFGYKAVEYSLETPNLSLQLTVAVTLATIVFFADIYFIIKDYV